MKVIGGKVINSQLGEGTIVNTNYPQITVRFGDKVTRYCNMSHLLRECEVSDDLRLAIKYENDEAEFEQRRAYRRRANRHSAMMSQFGRRGF